MVVMYHCIRQRERERDLETQVHVTANMGGAESNVLLLTVGGKSRYTPTTRRIYVRRVDHVPLIELPNYLATGL